MKRIPILIYIFVFFITLSIIGSALFAGSYINRKRTDQIQTDESKMAIDIFALEAKIDLLKDSECSTLNISTLPAELSDLSSRIDFMESQVGQDDPTMFRLKRYYALLEIKDYLINQKIIGRCSINIPTIIYLYSDKSSCSDCTQEEYILEALHTRQPDVHIYYLDYNNDIHALKTYTNVQPLPASLPILIINNKTYSGLMGLDTLETMLNAQRQKATTTAKVQATKK